jgi:hypothetical protein
MLRQKLCFKCNFPWDREGLVPFDATCYKCKSHLHVCQNCALFDPLSERGCRHAKGEPGTTPLSKNFCEKFVFRESLNFTVEADKLDRKTAEKKWRDLFGDR